MNNEELLELLSKYAKENDKLSKELRKLKEQLGINENR